MCTARVTRSIDKYVSLYIDQTGVYTLRIDSAALHAIVLTQCPYTYATKAQQHAAWKRKLLPQRIINGQAIAECPIEFCIHLTSVLSAIFLYLRSPIRPNTTRTKVHCTVFNCKPTERHVVTRTALL